MEIKLLGPIEIVVAGRTVSSGTPRQRAVLAALAVDAGRSVPPSTLIDRVWGSESPVQARDALYVYVARLRRVIKTADDAHAHLAHRSGGYVLDIDPACIDIQRFQRLRREAADRSCVPERRSRLLRSALDLWRGEPLAAMPGEWATGIREAWHQERLGMAVSWADSELNIGNAATTIGPLIALSAEYPLVEALTLATMRALHACGQSATALEHYTAARQRLIDELGMDPGPDLQQLQQAILQGDIDLRSQTAASQHQVRTFQLPAEVSGFCGREAELNALDEIAAIVTWHPAGRVAVLSGAAGIGKTALAVHWGHRATAGFPDGQMFVDLRGFGPDGRAAEPAEALGGILHMLGIPWLQIPATVDTQASLYRSLLTGKRLLLILDNARNAAQVRPLLPVSLGCMAVVTSRLDLAGLVAVDGADHLTLFPLPHDEARALLGQRIGVSRLRAEAEAAEEIVRRCGGLPLALVIVAARAVVQTGYRLDTFATELRGDASLDAFVTDDPTTDPRSVFSWSIRLLNGQSATLFRLLSLLPGDTFCAAAAATVAAMTPEATGRALADLVRAHLLSEGPPGRYWCHDLLRAYAGELVAAKEPADAIRQATERILDYYLHSAHAAQMLTHHNPWPTAPRPPQAGVVLTRFASREHARGWSVQERSGLFNAVYLAAAQGYYVHAWQLAWTASVLSGRQAYEPELLTAAQMAMTVVYRLGDHAAAGQTERFPGHLHRKLGNPAEAESALRRAPHLSLKTTDNAEAGCTRLILACLLESSGRLLEALDEAEIALDEHSRAGHLLDQARALNAIGWYRVLLGQPHHALSPCRTSLALYQQLDAPHCEADAWDSLGFAYHYLGDQPQAIPCLARAAALHRELGGRYFEASALMHLGEAHRASNDPGRASTAWETALFILSELGHPDADSAREKLADLNRRSARCVTSPQDPS